MDFLKGLKKPMKKYAAIDIGTNSMRLLLATIKDGKIIEQKKYINTTRIGSSVDKNKVIGKEGIEKNVEAFCNFVQKVKEYGAEKISAIATSAVREAKNKEELIQTIYQKTGINVKTISGKEEAELGYKGVIMGMECHFGADNMKLAHGESENHEDCGINHGDCGINHGDCPHGQPFLTGGPVPVLSLVIDIGGGSTELILGEGSVLKEIISLDVGAVRMTERFVASNPVGREEHEKMEAEIYRITDGIYGRLVCHPETDSINGAHEGSRFSTPIAIGVGGTITTLAALHQKLDPYDPGKVHNYRLTLEDINSLKEKLLSLTVQQIKQLKGIHPKRADIIVAGVTILSILMKDLNLKEIRASEYDNLEGMLYCMRIDQGH